MNMRSSEVAERAGACYSKHMLERLRRLPELTALPLLIIVGLLFFMLTNPERLPPVALMIGFIILGGTIYCGVRLALRATGVHDRLKRGQYRVIVVAVTALPVLLLALQSLGQLTVRDTLTLVILVAGGALYAYRMSS